jgi:hypothetical protein
MIAKRSEKGWEIADDNGIFEDESISTVYPTKKACQDAINAQKIQSRGFDELRATEAKFD